MSEQEDNKENKENKIDVCPQCGGHGGVIIDDLIQEEGLPVWELCPTCSPPSYIDYL